MFQIINFFKPLIMDTEKNELSLARFWFTTLILFCVHYWLILHIEVPASLIQIIMIIAAYLFCSKTVQYGSSATNKYLDNRMNEIKMKNTPEVSKYKAEADAAAKCDE